MKIKSFAKKIITGTKTQALLSNPLSSYNKMNPSDMKDFAPILDVWRPSSGEKGVLLRWQMTMWCNYGCSYCDQDHSRKPLTHAFDHHSVTKWLSFLEKHFQDKKLVLVITGGETMLDVKNMRIFLQELSTKGYVDNIRIDTNASWNPEKFSNIDTSKMLLNCSLHTEQVEEAVFVDKINQIRSYGWKIGMINYVMSEDQFVKFEERRKLFADLDVPLNPNPLWSSGGKYSKESLSFLRKYLPESDLKYKCGLESPYDKKCLFPSVAYMMDSTGAIQVGCHPQLNGSLFNDELPDLPSGVMKCPSSKCMCLDQYSFLKELNLNTSLNPFEQYCRRLM